jgi:hypothetical protein
MLGARGRLFSVDGFILESSGELGVGAFAEFPRLRMQSWKELSREILKMAPIANDNASSRSILLHRSVGMACSAHHQHDASLQIYSR